MQANQPGRPHASKDRPPQWGLRLLLLTDSVWGFYTVPRILNEQGF